MKTVANSYRETEVMTASPERLHLMVVEAAVRFARQGEAALRVKDYDVSYHALSQCRSCVSEIIGGISNDPNPELAERLKALFAFAYRNLVQADLLHDPQPACEVLKILEAHRQTWLELMARLQQEQAENRRPVVGETAATSWTA